MNITLERYVQILDAGYTLDILYILKLIRDNVDMSGVLDHPKISAIQQMLLRKSLLSSENKVTLSGEDLLRMIEEDNEKPLNIIKRVTSSDFDKWWLTYMPSNMFVYKGKTFSGTQSKRIKKDDCKKAFAKILNEGISAEDITGATEYHFQVAKELSYKHGKNEISYIPNSLRYLSERMFQPYVEMHKNKVKIEEQKPIEKFI